ncbi:MAG TPA: hypothetical protein VK971_03585 [Thiohalobacter sp.]|nr:hypothetical protein [Thiohalobacter sp.]
MSDMHAFDTLEFAKTLRNSGYTETQAEGMTKALDGVCLTLQSDLARKADIQDLRREIADVRKDLGSEIADVRREIADVRKDLGHRIDNMAHQLTIRTGGMLVLAVGALSAMKYFG